MWQHFGHLQWQTCLIARVLLQRRRKDHGKSLEVVRSLRLALCPTRMMKVLQQVNSSELLIANLTLTKVIWLVRCPLYVLAFTNIFVIIVSMRCIHKMNRHAVAMMFVRVCCPFGMGMHCDHTVHFSADCSSQLDSPLFWAPWRQSMPTYSQPSFSSSTWNIGGYICAN